MFREKLTRIAEWRARTRVATPVIVLTKSGRLEEIFNYALQFELSRKVIDRVEGLLGLLPAEVTSFGVFRRMFRRFNMFSVFLSRDGVFELADVAGVEKIFSDEPMWAFIQGYPTVPSEGVFELSSRREMIQFTTTAWTKRLLGLDEANRKGFTGRGVKVSVVDTGAPRFHEAMRRCELRSTIPFQKVDENGHGTWCVACIGGERSVDTVLSRSLGREVLTEGMAPECDMLAVKSLGLLVGTGPTSWILQGIEESLEWDAKVISLSLGGEMSAERPDDDPYFHALLRCEEQGTIPVIAAGNSGPLSKTVNSPGWLPNCLCVGAYNPLTGELAEFSSRGPAPWGVKPDCVAPGVNVHAPCVNALDISGDRIPQRYSFLSGTSMATPHIAGLVAVASQAWRELLGRELTLSEIFYMLSELGHPKNNEDGWGRLDWWMVERWLSTEYGVELGNGL